MSTNGSIIPNLPREDYDRIDAVNWSRLKAMLRSPAHYRHGLLAKHVDTDAKKRGRAVHLAILEPDRFQAECVVWTEGPRKGKAWAKFSAANADREILTEKEHDLCLQLSAAVRGSADAMRYLTGGHAEATMRWALESPAREALDGWRFDCKGRVDYVAAAIADVKSTKDASPAGFGREVWRYQYHCQAAFYADGHEAATGVRLPFVLIAVETEPPHVVQVYRISDEILDLGREAYRACLDRLAFCKREGDWSGYATGEELLALPRWAVPSSDEDVSELDLVIGE